MRRKAPLVITGGLGLLVLFMVGAIAMAPAESTDAARLAAARQALEAQGGQHQSANHISALEGEVGAADFSESGFPKTSDGRYVKVPFGALSGFDAGGNAPDDILSGKPSAPVIPEHLTKLDKSDVMLVGYMVPLEMDNEGRVTSFAFTQNQDYCCYGETPNVNEFAVVTVPPGLDPPKYTEKPFTVAGDFEVGAESYDGYVSSIYRMTAREILPADAFAG